MAVGTATLALAVPPAASGGIVGIAVEPQAPNAQVDGFGMVYHGIGVRVWAAEDGSLKADLRHRIAHDHLWSSVEPLPDVTATPAPGMEPTAVRVAVSDWDEALVAWGVAGGGGYAVFRPRGQEDWQSGPPQPTGAGDPLYLSGFTRDGKVYGLFDSAPGGRRVLLRRDPDGSWQPEDVQLPEHTSEIMLSVEVNAGHVLVAWFTDDGPAGPGVYASQQVEGGTFEVPVKLGPLPVPSGYHNWFGGFQLQSGRSRRLE